MMNSMNSKHPWTTCSSLLLNQLTIRCCLKERTLTSCACTSHNLNAEVTEHDDEVMVTVDMIPGSEHAKISVDLVNPDTLKITCDREEGETGDRDLRSFSLHHIIPLPCNVITKGANATYKHGIFDIHLRKARAENK